jgi:hypothetical protein
MLDDRKPAAMRAFSVAATIMLSHLDLAQISKR